MSLFSQIKIQDQIFQITQACIPRVSISALYYCPHVFIKKGPANGKHHCDPGGARTLDPMIKSHLLYQLSYGVVSSKGTGAKVTLFEKPAKRLFKKFSPPPRFLPRSIAGSTPGTTHFRLIPTEFVPVPRKYRAPTGGCG